MVFCLGRKFQENLLDVNLKIKRILEYLHFANINISKKNLKYEELIYKIN